MTPTSSQSPLRATAIPKLYLLTNDDDIDLLLSKLAVALATGSIHLLQIRRKKVLAQTDGLEKLYKEGLKIVALATHYGVKVVMNDDIDLAARLGVGVHLGQEDGSILEAKRRLDPKQIIGRTCQGNVQWVNKAREEGASYAAMGAMFASNTKRNAKMITRAQLVAGTEQGIDICIIGGLNTKNIHELKGLPITYVAVVGDIMDLSLDKIAKRCQQWQKALNNWHSVK